MEERTSVFLRRRSISSVKAPPIVNVEGTRYQLVAVGILSAGQGAGGSVLFYYLDTARETAAILFRLRVLLRLGISRAFCSYLTSRIISYYISTTITREYNNSNHSIKKYVLFLSFECNSIFIGRFMRLRVFHEFGKVALFI